MSAKKDTDYLFLSAMLRARETKLVSQGQLARISVSAEDAAAVLEECGYARPSPLTVSSLERSLEQRRAELLRELAALAPEPAVVDFFRLRYDYHNARVLVRLGGAAEEDMLSSAGRVDARVFRECAARGDLSPLPRPLADAFKAARELTERTGSAQLADILLDQAWFSELAQYAERAKSGFLMGYVRVFADGTNIRAAVRAARMGKDRAFMLEIFVPGGDLAPESLVAAALGERSFAGLAPGELGELADEAARGGSLAALDAACGRAAERYLASAGRVSFGVEPLISYICAVESEIKTLRRAVGATLRARGAERV